LFPYLALLACVAIIAWLFKVDLRQRKAGSSALWIPGLWILVEGSRPVSYWFSLAGFSPERSSDIDSSPINTMVYLGLICGALLILLRRGYSWPALARYNTPLVLIYLFFAASSLWAPYGFVTFRRIIKDFGCVLVALVVLTEDRPWYRCRALFVRVSYVLIPLSFIVAKYFPLIGRGRFRAGETMYTGLTTHKNTLGEVTLILILFVLWDLLEVKGELDPGEYVIARRMRLLIFAMGAVLLALANSTTSDISLILGIALFLVFRRMIAKQQGHRLLRWGLVLSIVGAILEKTFNIAAAIVGLFGRNMTFTGRTEIWDEALKLQNRPLLGFGYYSFWDTSNADALYEALGDFIHIRTVHNGYIEIFIDGGIVGVTLFAFFLFAIIRRSYKSIYDRNPAGAMPLVICVIALIYNNTESSYFRMDLLWFTLLLLTTKPDDRPFELTVSPARLRPSMG
jgi:exopolysaccharide production protein ExoQ